MNLVKRSEIFQLLTELSHQGLSREQITQRVTGRPGGNMYQELEMDSDMVDTHEDFSATSVGQHTHLFTELLYWVDGGMEYLLGTRRYQIHPGDIVLVPPGVIHCPILPQGSTSHCHRHVVWISPAFSEILLDLFPTSDYKDQAVLLRTKGTRYEYLEEYFIRGLREANAKAPGWETCLYANTAQLVVLLGRALEAAGAPLPQREEKGQLELVLDYIQHNLDQKITLSSTARHFLVCESTISQLFRKKMGISFYRCVTQRRLAAAKSLIGQGISMDQVSVMVGFQDYSCFYRAFKSEYGISPTLYRKQLQD